MSHCPEHIAIADILRYERYALDYHELSRARAEYKTLTKDGTACIACGDCLPACKADINIVAKLKEVHRLLGYKSQWTNMGLPRCCRCDHAIEPLNSARL